LVPKLRSGQKPDRRGALGGGRGGLFLLSPQLKTAAAQPQQSVPAPPMPVYVAQSRAVLPLRDLEEKRLVPERFDREYVDRLREGHPETQRHFTRYFGELLDIKLRRRLRLVHLMEEVRQETFLRVLVALRRDSITHPERLGAFVNAICNNVLLETFRTEGRVKQLPEGIPDPIDQGPSAESTLVTKQRSGEVRKILGEMPEKDRQLLRQLFLEERDKDEICKTFQVDRDYLRVLLHRAKIRFRSALEQTSRLEKASRSASHGGQGGSHGS